MRLNIRHRTVYAYEPAALRVALRLRLWPSRHEGQSIEKWSVTVNDQPVSALLTDDFGGETGLWHAHHPVDEVEVIAEGVVETTETSGIVKGLGRARAGGVFLRRTPLTAADEAIFELAQSAKEKAGENGGDLAVLHALMGAVHEAIDYRPGATDSETTAAKALAVGAGVCQDHSHVFISAARALDLPARYVSGYLLFGEDDGDELRETHGWAEALVEGLGWIGFDAANDVCPTERYVRLVAGLDARDAAPIRGTVMGGSEETLEAEVTVSPAGGQSQSQTQQQ